MIRGQWSNLPFESNKRGRRGGVERAAGQRSKSQNVSNEPRGDNSIIYDISISVSGTHKNNVFIRNMENVCN